MALLLGRYQMFFAASAGASAAILGLLVVAVSVVNADDSDAATRERRTVLAGSVFLALVDVFFVSIVALTGGAMDFGASNLVMALVGLLATSHLIPRAKRAGNFSRGFATRRINLLFAVISVGGYAIQLGLAIALLADPHNANFQHAAGVGDGGVVRQRAGTGMGGHRDTTAADSRTHRSVAVVGVMVAAGPPGPTVRAGGHPQRAPRATGRTAARRLRRMPPRHLPSPGALVARAAAPG